MDAAVESLGGAADCLELGVLQSDHLPQYATELLVAGVDTPSLCELAGLDLGPFDTRDAIDLLGAAIEEAGVRHSGATAVARAAQVLAVAELEPERSVALTLRRFARLAVRAGYPDDADVMNLYGLDDEWDNAGWGRSDDQIEAEVHVILGRLARRFDPPHAALVNAVAASF